MIPNFNTPSSSHSSQPIEPPVITRYELESLLKAWILNPSTNVSIEDGKKIAKKILIFYTLETDSKYAPYRKQALEIIDCQAKSLPDIFSYPPFTRLTSLNLQMGLSELPESLSQLQALKSLNVSNNALQHLPDSINKLSQLVDLNVSHNLLNQLPEDLHQLSQLQKCDISFNKINEIPNNLDRLQNLTALDLSDNNLSTLPESFSQCKSLTHLDLSRNNFSQVPESVTRLEQIQELNLGENTLSSLPDISQWKELKRLDLRNNTFTEWPKALESLSGQAAVLLDYHFSAWKTATLVQQPLSDNEYSEISDNESSYISDSESSDEDSSENSTVILQDRIEIPNNPAPAEGVRKRKAEKFRIQSEIARKVLKENPPLVITDDGGSSFIIFGEIKDKPIGVYKPRIQKEKDTVAGVPVGTEAFRERLAYALNYELSQLFTESDIPLVDFGVPPTRIMDFRHKLFGKQNKTGSLQKYRKNCITLHNASAKKKISETNTNELFKAAILDLIFLNKDRHNGNLLYSEEKNKINLIDHGACFPEIAGLQEFDLGWKELPFIHEPLPKSWIKFIVSIRTDALINRTIQEIAIHTKAFPGEKMSISGESLFVMIFAIQSLQQFVTTHETPTIGQYLDHLLPKTNFHYVEIKNPENNTSTFQEFSEELPLGYINVDSTDKEMKKFNEHSFDVMGRSVLPMFSKTTPSSGELTLKAMCEKYGFQNVILHGKNSIESKFYEQAKEAFEEYTKDKKEITPDFIHQNLDEVQKYITSYLSSRPILSLIDRCRQS